jgi:hypothetical protein
MLWSRGRDSICECGTVDVQSRRHAFAFGAQRARYERKAARSGNREACETHPGKRSGRFCHPPARAPSLSPFLPESANRQRATMQTPQGLDATHGSELFPVKRPRSVFHEQVRRTPSAGLGLFRVQQGLNVLRSPAGSSPGDSMMRWVASVLPLSTTTSFQNRTFGGGAGRPLLGSTSMTASARRCDVRSRTTRPVLSRASPTPDNGGYDPPGEADRQRCRLLRVDREPPHDPAGGYVWFVLFCHSITGSLELRVQGGAQ